MTFSVQGLLMQEARYKTDYITKAMFNRIKNIRTNFTCKTGFFSGEWAR